MTKKGHSPVTVLPNGKKVRVGDIVKYSVGDFAEKEGLDWFHYGIVRGFSSHEKGGVGLKVDGGGPIIYPKDPPNRIKMLSVAELFREINDLAYRHYVFRSRLNQAIEAISERDKPGAAFDTSIDHGTGGPRLITIR